MPLNTGQIDDSGDLDGDGLVDGLISTSGDGESAFVLTHSAGTPGSTARPAKLDAAVRVFDAVGQQAFGAITVSGSCGGKAFGPTAAIWGVATTVTLNAAEGDACTASAQDAVQPGRRRALCEVHVEGHGEDPHPRSRSTPTAASRSRRA
ncbi:MAG: hypothetical protein PGN13_10525 [Patulibacter minatonensis]